MHTPRPIYLPRRTDEFSDAAFFEWRVTVPSSTGVTITLPDVDGYRWDKQTVMVAPNRTGDVHAIARPIDGAGTEGKLLIFRPHIAGWGIAFDGHVLRALHRDD